MTDMRSMAEAALADDDDHMLAQGDDLDWLVAQITCWPTRVHEERTTNDRFLRMSAAATLLANHAEIVRLENEIADMKAARDLQRASVRHSLPIERQNGGSK